MPSSLIPAEGEPLDRFLTRALGWSWSDVRRAIQHRRASVNGVVCKRYHRKLVGGERIVVDGLEVPPCVDRSVLLMHKPAGLACSHLASEAPLLYEIVPTELAHPDLHSCGRLDRDTTGLLVLTFDGALTQLLTDPRHACAKRYRIAYAGVLDAEAVARVAAGLPLPDEARPCLPARLTLDGDAPDGLGLATLVLHEGRHHQVKRMIAALGGEVRRLHRDRIGGLELPADLQEASVRIARAGEVAALLDGA